MNFRQKLKSSCFHSSLWNLENLKKSQTVFGSLERIRIFALNILIYYTIFFKFVSKSYCHFTENLQKNQYSKFSIFPKSRLREVHTRQSILKFEVFIIFVYLFWTFLSRGVDSNRDKRSIFSPGWRYTNWD